MKLSIIVPCYNEKETVGEVLKRILKLQLPCETELIAVDDGSKDGSAKVVEEFLNVTLVRHEVNKGKGSAIRTGIKKSSGDAILIQDADLEYFPEDIVNLVQPILSGEADIVLGSRFLGNPKGMSRTHFLANKTLSFATRALFGGKITDLMTGYKLFTRQALQQISVTSESFDVEAELVGKLLKRKLRIVEVPIKYEYRRKGKAKITWTHGFSSFWTLFKVKYGE